MAGKKKSDRASGRKRDLKRATTTSEERKGDAKIRSAEKALSKSLHELERAREELTRREHELTRLLAKYGRLPEDIESNGISESEANDGSFSLLDQNPESEQTSEVVESTEPSDAGDPLVLVAPTDESVDPETFALFDQRQVVR